MPGAFAQLLMLAQAKLRRFESAIAESKLGIVWLKSHTLSDLGGECVREAEHGQQDRDFVEGR